MRKPPYGSSEVLFMLGLAFSMTAVENTTVTSLDYPAVALTTCFQSHLLLAHHLCPLHHQHTNFVHNVVHKPSPYRHHCHQNTQAAPVCQKRTSIAAVLDPVVAVATDLALSAMLAAAAVLAAANFGVLAVVDFMVSEQNNLGN